MFRIVEKELTFEPAMTDSARQGSFFFYSFKRASEFNTLSMNWMVIKIVGLKSKKVSYYLLFF